MLARSSGVISVDLRAFFKPGPLGRFLGPSLAELGQKPAKTKIISLVSFRYPVYLHRVLARAAAVGLRTHVLPSIGLRSPLFRPRCRCFRQGFFASIAASPGPVGRIEYFSCFCVFGRLSAKLGPKTPLERRGSSYSAGCTKNQGAPEGAPEGPRRGPPVFRHVEVGFCQFWRFFVDFDGFQARRSRIVPEGAGH